MAHVTPVTPSVFTVRRRLQFRPNLKRSERDHGADEVKILRLHSAEASVAASKQAGLPSYPVISYASAPAVSLRAAGNIHQKGALPLAIKDRPGRQTTARADVQKYGQGQV